MRGTKEKCLEYLFIVALLEWQKYFKLFPTSPRASPKVLDVSGLIPVFLIDSPLRFRAPPNPPKIPHQGASQDLRHHDSIHNPDILVIPDI